MQAREYLMCYSECTVALEVWHCVLSVLLRLSYSHDVWIGTLKLT